MIALAAFLLTWRQPIKHDFVFRRDSSVTECAFAAVAILPPLNPREINQLQVALELIPKGSSEYSIGTIRQLLQGATIHCNLTPDAVSISFAVPNGAEQSGESLLISLLKSPAFDEDEIPTAVQSLNQKSEGYWQREVDPRPMAIASATHQDLLDIFHKVFNLSNVEVGAISSHNLPLLADAWDKSTVDWPPVPEPPLLEDPPPLPLPKTQPRVSTAEFIASTIKPASPDFAANVLALYALGTGKVSSLFRIAREKHAWSYEQESLLWPSSEGWQPRLFLALAPSEDNRKRLDQLVPELVADVGTWNSDIRDAAVGMAEANLLRQVPYGPITWNGQALTRDPEQRVAFDLYWMQKTGAHFSGRDLFSALEAVDLSDLKTAALAILNSSKLHYLPAES
jgi:hypothetical protein